jgi:hypothetical protein
MVHYRSLRYRDCGGHRVAGVQSRASRQKNVESVDLRQMRRASSTQNRIRNGPGTREHRITAPLCPCDVLMYVESPASKLEDPSTELSWQ